MTLIINFLTTHGDTIAICGLIISFVLLLTVLRLWAHFEKERKQNPIMSEEDKLIYDTYIKPVANELKGYQNQFRTFCKIYRSLK